MSFEDVREITDLIVDYAACLDEGCVDQVAEMFADARMTIRFEGRVVVDVLGAEAVRDLLSRSHAMHDGLPSTHHVTTNIRVQIDGDQAIARSYVTLMQAAPGFPLQVVSCGVYRDRFRRSATGWRFSERISEARLVGDLSRRLAADALPSLSTPADRSNHTSPKEKNDG